MGLAKFLRFSNLFQVFNRQVTIDLVPIVLKYIIGNDASKAVPDDDYTSAPYPPR